MVAEGAEANGGVGDIYNTCWWSWVSQVSYLNGYDFVPVTGADTVPFYQEFDYDEGTSIFF